MARGSSSTPAAPIRTPAATPAHAGRRQLCISSHAHRSQASRTPAVRSRTAASYTDRTRRPDHEAAYDIMRRKILQALLLAVPHGARARRGGARRRKDLSRPGCRRCRSTAMTATIVGPGPVTATLTGTKLTVYRHLRRPEVARHASRKISQERKRGVRGACHPRSEGDERHQRHDCRAASISRRAQVQELAERPLLRPAAQRKGRRRESVGLAAARRRRNDEPRDRTSLRSCWWRGSPVRPSRSSPVSSRRPARLSTPPRRPPPAARRTRRTARAVTSPISAAATKRRRSPAATS